MNISRYSIFCFKLLFRQRKDIVLPLFFFLMVTSLFPLTLPKGAANEFAAIIIWVMAFLSILLSLNTLFHEDKNDGFLDQMLTSGEGLSSLVAIKIAVHWIGYILPILVSFPLLALWYGLGFEKISMIMYSLLLGTPVILIIGASSAALAVGLKQAGLLLFLTTLPLSIPILLFSLSMVELAVSGLSYAAPQYFLIAMAIFSITLGPLLVAQCLRINVG
jgi:heme exporter protein B